MANGNAGQRTPTLALPQISVDTSSVRSDETSRVLPQTPISTQSPSLLSTPNFTGRDRSLSGSTAHSDTTLLRTPESPTKDLPTSKCRLTLEQREDTLRPDNGFEKDFVVKDNKFAFSPGQLNKLLNPKSLAAYSALGGLRGIERGLRTNVETGLSVDENLLDGAVTFEDATTYAYTSQESPSFLATDAPDGAAAAGNSFKDRIKIFSNNALPEKKATPLWKLMWMAYKDKILILLTVAAIISLALGLYEVFGVDHPEGSPPPIDYVEGLAICIAIIIVVLVVSLNDYQKERAFVKLNAKKEDRTINVIRSSKSHVIGVHGLLAGDVVHLEPGDMVPADGIFISGHNVKCDESSATGESDALRKTPGDQVMRMLAEGHTELKQMDPFIISGSKVQEGAGTYLVTSVGVNSTFGKIMMAMRVDMQPTPLQVKLDGLASAIAKLGSTAAILLFFILLFRFATGLSDSTLSSSQQASQFVDILIVSVTIIVVAVPEGLPLAVTLALAFASTRMAKMNNLVRILKSCETMGNATTICSDKTGTLTQNVMTVVTDTFFGTKTFDDKNNSANETRLATFANNLSNDEKRQLIDAITTNSTAFESDNGFIGSKTENALLSFARSLGMGPLSEERSNATIIQLVPFDSRRKCMGAVQRLCNGTYRLNVTGASETLLGHCTSMCSSACTRSMTSEDREALEKLIDHSGRQLAARMKMIFSQADFDAVLKEMIFTGIVGIQDPLRPGVPEAVQKCHMAGVSCRMVTGDNVVTARAVATDCGIYTDGIVMEGPVFRILSDAQMAKTLPRLQVLARSSPEDKRILVTKLRELGEVVAVTGDGTNDGPALKAADIGFSMGISGTEVAKEASAIILMDDNFTSILTALMWGRAVNDAVGKFLQFQITVNITAVIIASVSALASSDMRPVLTAVQLLWINLIMDSLAALALASDPPTEEILDRKPLKRSAPLISITMWKQVIGQAILQLIITFTMYYGAPAWLGIPSDGLEIRSLVFATYVNLQISNMLNNRRLDNKFNVFQGVFKNYFFVVVFLAMIGCQVMIIIGIGLLSLPFGVLIRLFPDWLFEKIAKIVGKPVVLVYRPLHRLSGKMGRKIKGLRRKSKESKESEKVEEVAEEEARVEEEGRRTDVEKGRA
nr:hypothetical protein B0A51_04142 [Rachicladosporium sp. CCFEE 5018]